MENDDQQEAVEDLLEKVKAAEKTIGAARDADTKPKHETWKAAVGLWKEPLDARGREKTALAALLTPYKNAKAAALAEEQRRLQEEANRKRREAEDLAAKAIAGDLASQEAAVAAKVEFQETRKVASAAKKVKVTGLHTVWHCNVEDHHALLNWVAKNDRAAMLDFLNEYAAKNHRTAPLAGVKSWSEKVAKS